MGKKISLMSSCGSIVPRSIKPPIAKGSLQRWLSPRRMLSVPESISSDDDCSARSPPADTVDLSHIHRYLVENFPSLYTGIATDENDSLFQDTDDDDDICRVSHITRPGNVSPPLSFPPPHAVRASDRFFVPVPRAAAGSSLLEEARLSAASASSCSSSSFSGGGSSGGASCCPPSYSSSLSSSTATGMATARPSPSPSSDGTAVEKFSKEPYDDFVKSMMAMVEAHRQAAGRTVEWEFMEELLFSYLELNDRSVYKDILRAFADVSSSLRSRVDM